MTGGDDDDDALFRDAMRGVDPIERTPRARVSGERRAAKPPAEPRIRVDGDTGRAPGVNKRRLADLRGGRIPPVDKIDLHGMGADAARDTLRRRIDTAARAGARCVLVIHGKGRHSPGGPVLRDVAVATLTSAPTSRLIKAFCPALPRDGGAGAMYVLL